MKILFNKILVLLILAITIVGCKKEPTEKGSAAYIKKIENWHTQRIANLKKPGGWLNLVGLYWLKPGENTFGTNPGNDVVFPEGKSPGVVGTFNLTGRKW